MSVVVSDTTAITYLLQVGHLDLLPELFGKVQIPRAVETELFQLAWQKSQLQELDWLIVVDVDVNALKAVHFVLDQGETEAIALALATNANLLIIDEIAGRRIAAQNAISIIGIIGVLVLAKSKKLIPAIRPILAQIVGLGFRVNPKLLASLYQSVGE